MIALAYIRDTEKRPWCDKTVKLLAKAADALVRSRKDLFRLAHDYSIHWSFKDIYSPALRRAKEVGIPVLIIEAGYYWDRLENFSLGWNGINGRAIRPSPGDEMRPFPLLKNWVRHRPESGGRILIPLQVPGDASLEGVDIEYWACNKANELKARYPASSITIRAHPETSAGQIAVKEGLCKPILDVIRDYALVATYSSNVGVDAIRMGVPATADSLMSMIYVQNSRGRADYNYQDVWREKWAHELSYCQWTMQELEDGTALKHMLLALPEAKENAESGKYGQ